jgi:F-type H+-transporting ATPase subunit gamma
MEMVAASKLRQAQNRITASRPYFEILSQTISDIVSANRDFSSPYLRKREGNRVLFVVIAGDRGLAGGYNSNVIKLAAAHMAGRDATVLPIGKKALDYFRSKGYHLLAERYAEAAEVDIGDCFSIAKLLSRAFLKGEFDEVHLAYTNFVSVLSQTAAAKQLLPLIPEEREQRAGRSLTHYDPGPEEVFASIVPEYLGGVVYGALCESRCAEQAARRTAMDSATSNAEDMIADLSLKYNRARQAAITQEITEIVAGAEA